jgi:hypothetical protein
MSRNSQYPLCWHVHANGALCQSPALKRQRYCYFHLRERQRREVLFQARQAASHTLKDADVFDTLDLPMLEDANAIQVAASTMFHALGTRQIRPRRAALMLYALQIAHANLRGVRVQPLYNQLVVQKDPEPIEFLSQQEEDRATATEASDGDRVGSLEPGARSS